MRMEYLNENKFAKLKFALEFIENWRNDYNNAMSHSALNDPTLTDIAVQKRCNIL